jgi:hypothetical protein
MGIPKGCAARMGRHSTTGGLLKGSARSSRPKHSKVSDTRSIFVARARNLHIFDLRSELLTRVTICDRRCREPPQ